MSFLPELDTEVQSYFIKQYDSEPEYRADKEAYNYSRQKDFMTDPLMVYRAKHVTGTMKTEPSEEMDFGSLIDCMKFEPHLKDEKYGISSAPTPTDGPLRFVKELIELVKINKVWLGPLAQFDPKNLPDTEEEMLENSNRFTDLLPEAYKRSGIKTPGYEKFITERFTGTDVEVYFAERLENEGKKTFGADVYERAERVLKFLNESDATKDILAQLGEVIKVNEQGEVIEHKEYLGQLPIKVMLEGHLVRVMYDQVELDHLNKTATPRDMKILGTPINDFPWTFFRSKYYIQQGNYEAAFKLWMDEKYPDYTIKPFEFIVGDSSGFSEPLIYCIKAPEGQSFLRTFTVRDRSYTSGLDIIELIKYHEENNLWTTSKRNRENKGRVEVNL